MAEFDKISFATRVRGLAEEYGSEAKLALASKFTQQTINQWAKGRREPKIDTVKKMCGPIGINPVWLLYGTGPKYASETEDTSSSGINWKEVTGRIREIFSKWGGVPRTADLTGIDGDILTRWFEGEITDEDLGKPHLHDFSEKTGVSWQWLLHGEGTTLKPEVAKDVAAKEWMKEPSFKEWLLPLLSNIPRGDSEDANALILASAQYFFWLELADLSHDHKPEIPAGEWADILGESLEDIEALISAPPTLERVKIWAEKISALNKGKGDPRHPLDPDRLIEKAKNIGESQEMVRQAQGAPPPIDRTRLYSNVRRMLAPLSKIDGYVRELGDGAVMEAGAEQKIQELSASVKQMRAEFIFSFIQSLCPHEMSMAEFAKHLGVDMTTFDRWAHDPPGPDMANHIAEIVGLDETETGVLVSLCKQFHYEYYGYTNGHFNGSPAHKQDVTLYTDEALDTEPVMDAYAYVPKFNLALAAGDGRIPDFEEIEERYAFRKEWLYKKVSAPSNVVMFDVVGDSMEPIFSEGDVCLVDRGEKDIKNGRYYALRLGDAVHIKQIQPLNDKIKIVSLNRAYKPITVDLNKDADNAQIIGRVVWVGKEF